MKKVVLVLTFLALTAPLFANGGGNNNGQTGPQGPQGPQGPAGPRGLTGAAGSNGADGEDYHRQTKVIGEVDARLLDYKRLGLHLFNAYDLRAGRNDAIGARLMIKFGESYEEREIAELKKVIQELKSVAHRPGVHQERYWNEFNDDFYLYEHAKPKKGK